jgi:hypothetical protein
MSGEVAKPTFKELLDRRNISFSQFYETCVEIPTEDIYIEQMYASLEETKQL